MMRTWYNGYRFAPEAPGKVYNPTLVLYFLDRLQDYGSYPRQMLDANLAMDESKLTYLAREVPGQQAVLDVLQKDEPIEVDGIVDRFSLDEMVTSEGHHQTYLGSFLYYFGMLTLKGNWSSGGTLELTPPNLVTRKLYIDHVRRLLLVGEKDPDTPEDVPRADLWDLLLEFKYVQLRDLPGRPSGNELRQKTDADLLALKPVAKAFAAAEAQLARYRGVLAERFGVDLRLRSYAVVALGFERLLAREVKA